MNKDLRDGLEIAASYLGAKEQARIDLQDKKDEYARSKKRYEEVLRSSKRNGLTVFGILLMCGAVLLALISIAAVFIVYGDLSINADNIVSIVIGAGPFMVGAVIMLIMGFRLVSSRKSRKRAVEERAQKMLDEEVIPAEEAYNREFEEYKRKIDELDELYLDFVCEILPPSYRNFSAAYAIYDLVNNGRADTMKEAVNLYEVLKRDEERQQEFEAAVRSYEYAAQRIIDNQNLTNYQLRKIRDEIRKDD